MPDRNPGVSIVLTTNPTAALVVTLPATQCASDQKTPVLIDILNSWIITSKSTLGRPDARILALALPNTLANPRLPPPFMFRLPASIPRPHPFAVALPTWTFASAGPTFGAKTASPVRCRWFESTTEKRFPCRPSWTPTVVPLRTKLPRFVFGCSLMRL